ncbi:hypothetical protein BD309DRAFT_974111 [Dichomitus squalens]|nr:hypothetical protein BD309DRAFT_974111 [Dichomitus squalens]
MNLRLVQAFCALLFSAIRQMEVTHCFRNRRWRRGRRAPTRRDRLRSRTGARTYPEGDQAVAGGMVVLQPAGSPGEARPDAQGFGGSDRMAKVQGQENRRMGERSASARATSGEHELHPFQDMSNIPSFPDVS